MTDADQRLGDRSDPGDRTAVVIGASMAGICAAAALARNGWTVTLLERDRLPSGPQPRRGIPQDRLAHILLHRGLTAIDRLLPGFRAGLLARAAVSYDTGEMPWLSEYGWFDTEVPGYEVVSATRPLLDAVARDLLTALPGVTLRDGVRVSGLRRGPRGWSVLLDDPGPDADAGEREEVMSRIVVDASGRGTRFSRWLPDRAADAVQSLDARVGYAGRLYVERTPTPLRTGVMIIGSHPTGRSGLALPVEDRHWMISAAGLGDDRPPRDPVGYEDFLATLQDPAISELLGFLEPAGEVVLHRQTSNLRHSWGRSPDWPDGLLVVGDALCALNPIYGQGITVAAMQAELIDSELTRGAGIDRRLQRRLRDLTDIPWAIATGSDLRLPTCPADPTLAQRAFNSWTCRLARQAAAGNVRATATFSAVYHLMAPATAFLHPALVLAAARPAPQIADNRPAVLDELSRLRRTLSRPDPADA